MFGLILTGTVLVLLLQDAVSDHCKAVKSYNDIIYGLHWVLML